MAAVTVCSDFGAKNESLLLFPLFPHLFAWGEGTGCHDLSFLNVEFWANLFTLLFTFIKRLFSSSSLSAIRAVHLHTWVTTESQNIGQPLSNFHWLTHPVRRFLIASDLFGRGLLTMLNFTWACCSKKTMTIKKFPSPKPFIHKEKGSS